MFTLKENGTFYCRWDNGNSVNGKWMVKGNTLYFDDDNNGSWESNTILLFTKHKFIYRDAKSSYMYIAVRK